MILVFDDIPKMLAASSTEYTEGFDAIYNNTYTNILSIIILMLLLLLLPVLPLILLLIPLLLLLLLRVMIIITMLTIDADKFAD